MSDYVKFTPAHLGDPRWIEAGPDAFTIHVWSLAHCNGQLTNGRIQKIAAERITLPVPVDRTAAAIASLLELGLWSEDGEHYLIENYGTHALHSDEIVATRKRWADDKSRRRKHNNGVHDECTDKCPIAARNANIANVPHGQPTMSPSDKGNVSPPRPDQIRPDQTRPSGLGLGWQGDDERTAAAALADVDEGDESLPWDGLPPCAHGETAGDTLNPLGVLRCRQCRAETTAAEHARRRAEAEAELAARAAS